MNEIECPGCGMAATPDRLDIGYGDDGPVYVCPVCGADMGPAS